MAFFMCAERKVCLTLNLTNVIFNMKSYVSKINKNSKDGNVNKISKKFKKLKDYHVRKGEKRTGQD